MRNAYFKVNYHLTQPRTQGLFGRADPCTVAKLYFALRSYLIGQFKFEV